MNLRECTKCNIEKPLSDFRRENRTKIGYQAACKTCEARYKSGYMKDSENRSARTRSDQIRKLSYKDLYTSNPDLIDKEKFCPGCSNTKATEHFNTALSRKGGLRDYCKVCDREKYRIRYNELKQAIYKKLGAVCCRCDFADQRALQIDHINGGGNQEHKEIKNSIKFLKKVLADTTGAYQILCANCNWIKRSEEKEEPFYTRLLLSELEPDFCTCDYRPRIPCPEHKNELICR